MKSKLQFLPLIFRFFPRSFACLLALNNEIVKENGHRRM